MTNKFFFQKPLSLVVGSITARKRLVNGSFTACKFLATLLLLLTLGVGQMWGAAGDVIKEFDCNVSSANTYARQTPTCDGITWNVSWGQTSYIGTNKSQNYGNLKITNSTDLNAGKAVKSDITTSTQGYCAIIPQSTMANVGKITISCSALSGSPAVYVVSSTSLSSAYSQITLKTGSGLAAQGATMTTSGLTFEFDKKTTGTYYAIVLYSSSWYRLTSTDIQFIEGASSTPSYTVTASSSNTSWGTVSVSGTTITATPADCYQVVSGTGGYNVVSGTYSSITHTGNSNEISVTPTANCSIQVIFEKKTVNTYVDEIQGNDNIEDCGTHDAPSLDDKTPATSGTCTQQHWHFMGWVTEANKATPTDLNIIAPGTEMTAEGKTYYAVWAKGTEGNDFDGTHGGTFKIYADVSGTKYYATSTISSGKFGRTTTASDAAEFTIAPVTGGFTIKLGDDYVYYTGSTNLGTKNSSYIWTFASGVKGTWRANSETSGRGFIYRDGTGFGGYSTSNVTAGGSEYFDLEIGGGYEYSDYKAVCCTELGSINGSFFVSNQ